MRFKVGLTDEEISIENVRMLDKGPLKAAFTLVKHQPRAPATCKFTDCKYFEVGDKKWFNLPQKEVFKSGSEKKDYYPVVIYEDREYIDALKLAVVAAIKAHRESDSSTVSAPAKSLYGAAPYCGF